MDESRDFLVKKYCFFLGAAIGCFRNPLRTEFSDGWGMEIPGLSISLKKCGKAMATPSIALERRLGVAAAAA